MIPAVVIASEAKQSSGADAEAGLLRRFAPRNDGSTASIAITSGDQSQP
jgi:hypothetical protein